MGDETVPRRVIPLGRSFVRLFARMPDRPQKLVQQAGRDVAGGWRHSFFDDLFVGSSGPAIRASYDVIRYRLWDADQLNLVNWPADRDPFELSSHMAPSAIEEYSEQHKPGHCQPSR